MKFSTLVSGAAAGAAALFLLATGCSKDDDNNTTNPPAQVFPISGLSIGTVDTNQVLIVYDDTLARMNPQFNGIKVSIINGEETVFTDTIPFGTPQRGVVFLPAALGLELTYRFEAMVGDRLSDPTDITWATGVRIRRLADGSPIRLFEQTVEDGIAVGNGLALLDGDRVRPRVVQTNSPENGALDFLFGIGSVQGQVGERNIFGFAGAFSGLFLQNGQFSNGNRARAYEIRTALGVVNVTLQQQGGQVDTVPCFLWDSTYAGGGTTGGLLALENSQAPRGFAVLGKLMPEDLAVAAIVKGAPGGQGFVRGTPPQRHVDLEVLLQVVPGLPYARTSQVALAESLRATSRAIKAKNIDNVAVLR